MKKFLAVFLALILTLSLCACGGGRTDDSDSGKDGSISDDQKLSSSNDKTVLKPRKKLDEQISSGTCFSEGFALVKTKSDKIYCIDEKGEIVFEADSTLLPTSFGYRNEYFINGLICFPSAIYDTKGNLTIPEDLGVDVFHSAPMPAGYILAGKLTESYSSTKYEIGILDLDLKWVVKPTEDIFEDLEEPYDRMENNLSISTHNKYFDHYLYFNSLEKIIDLKSGEVVDIEDFDKELPSAAWYYSSSGFRNPVTKDKEIDLSDYDNLSGVGNFVNGKAPITFYNYDTESAYFTFIDEKGKFLFEPIKFVGSDLRIEAPASFFCKFDGDYLLIHSYSGHNAWCYDTSGNLKGSFACDTGGSFEICEGIIRVFYPSAYGNDETKYYSADFSPLF